MAVTRDNAAVGEAIQLRLFVRDSLGSLKDATVGPISIFDDDTDDLLETISAPTRLSKGVYEAVTDPAWNDQRRRVRDEWQVTPTGASDPSVVTETFLIPDEDECLALDHVDDGIAVRVGSTAEAVERGLFELRVTEDRMHENVPAGTPVSCLGDRLLDARQDVCRFKVGKAGYNPQSDPSLEIHPHTPWWNALIRMFDLAPSTRVNRVWLHDRVCAEIGGRPAVVLVFRYVACDPVDLL